MLPSLAHDPAPALDRHERRRAEGSACLSTLVGPVAASIGLAQSWCDRNGRALARVEADGIGPGAIIDAWLRPVDLMREAVTRLATRLDRSADELAASLSRMTPWERSVFLETALPDDTEERLCRRLIAGKPDAPPESPDRRLAALCDLLPLGRRPVILIAPGSPTDLERASNVLARLALAEPRFPAILAVDRATLAEYERSAPESRGKALIAQGIIPVEPAPDVPPSETFDIDRAARRLAREGASEGLVRRFVEAAREVDGQTDRARSAAERFLFERLESLPETAGLFRLNETLPFKFGPTRDIEVDLSARSLRLAVEVDGYYHFRDEDAYRRDRRKDLELQKHGYLVVRVLALDVVHRLDAVLDLISQAIAARRPLP